VGGESFDTTKGRVNWWHHCACITAFVVLGATTIHAQSSSSDSSQSCSALGTPQEDRNCQGTAQYGDQSEADTELNLTEVDE